MDDTTETGPDGLKHDFASAIRSSMPLIRQLASKPKQVPGDEFFHEIAQRLVDHLKRAGVEKVVRRRGTSHSFPPTKAPPA